MVPSELVEALRYAGPVAPFLIALWIFRKHIRFSFSFDGRDRGEKPAPKKRNAAGK